MHATFNFDLLTNIGELAGGSLRENNYFSHYSADELTNIFRVNY